MPLQLGNKSRLTGEYFFPNWKKTPASVAYFYLSINFANV